MDQLLIGFEATMPTVKVTDYDENREPAADSSNEAVSVAQ